MDEVQPPACYNDRYIWLKDILKIDVWNFKLPTSGIVGHKLRCLQRMQLLLQWLNLTRNITTWELASSLQDEELQMPNSLPLPRWVLMPKVPVLLPKVTVPLSPLRIGNLYKKKTFCLDVQNRFHTLGDELEGDLILDQRGAHGPKRGFSDSSVMLTALSK